MLPPQQLNQPFNHDVTYYEQHRDVTEAIFALHPVQLTKRMLRGVLSCNVVFLQRNIQEQIPSYRFEATVTGTQDVVAVGNYTILLYS